MKKRYFMAAMAAFFSFTSMAQQMVVNTNRTTVGLRGGVNFNTFNGKNAAGANLENNISTGFHAGLNAEIPVGSGFYVQPGALYSMKGAELKNNAGQVKLAYLEVPVNFVYKPILGMGNLLLGFGPYAGFAIGGEAEQGGTERSIDFDANYNAGDITTQFKKFDAGSNFLAGYEFANKLSFQINAQLGLVNINKEAGANDNSRVRNTGFGVSLGYRF